MNYKETTMVPNELFKLLPNLRLSSVVILLVIIRQTLGWYDPITKKRKVRDWISYRQFKKKTGLSFKTISQSINSLIQQNYIKATDFNGNELRSSESRKGKVRIYYQCLLIEKRKNNRTYVNKYREHKNKLPITKLTSTKLTLQKQKFKRLTDRERLAEIYALKKSNL